MIYTLANSLVLFPIILSLSLLLAHCLLSIAWLLSAFGPLHLLKLTFSQDIHIVNILTSLKSLLRFYLFNVSYADHPTELCKVSLTVLISCKLTYF